MYTKGFENLKLIPYYPAYEVSLGRYQDPYTCRMVDGIDGVYDLPMLKSMYDYLLKNGHLYYIGLCGVLLGDCAIFDYNMVAIVISPHYQSIGIGKRALELLIDKARDLGLESISAEIYGFNKASIGLFTKAGFVKTGQESYTLYL